MSNTKKKIEWEELDIEDLFSNTEEFEDDNPSPMSLILARYADKAFKFHTLHCSFNLSEQIAYKLSLIEGIERFIPISRYRALINFGKCFDIDEVKQKVLNEINKHFYPKALESEEEI